MTRYLLPLALVVAIGAGVVSLWSSKAQLMAESTPASTTAPEFAADTEWLQSKPLKLADLRGQVVVVHFWTFGCINCIHNYPAYKSWYDKFAGKGVTIVGIHTPEFEREADARQVKAKAEEHGLKFPIAVDRSGTNWKNWKNQYWPAIYLVDKRGQVREKWEGELGQDGERSLRRKIKELIAEKL